MSEVAQFLQDTHGLVRWFILSLALVGSARAFVSMLSVSGKFTRLDQGLSNAYRGLLSLQGVLGLLLIIAALTLQTSMPWLHLIVMLPAIGISHLTRRFRARPDRTRQQYQLGIYLSSLALVAIGLAVINQLYLP
ncbi:MAG: hypothetical protein HY870_07525 [Chloroflexi bacterium]|nr:hypothetical protein [Chloroflexota bacterium]